MGTICVFLTTTWDCKNWVLTWIWAKERQLSNLQALYFTSFHLFLLSKVRHFTAIFIHCGAISSKWDLFQGFSSNVSTKCHPLTQVSGHQNETFWRFFIHSAHLEWEKKNTLENFQILCSWNETIFEHFHPQWSLNNPKKLCAFTIKRAKIQALSDSYSQYFWDWNLDTYAVCLHFCLFVYIGVSCLFTFQFGLNFSALPLLLTQNKTQLKEMNNEQHKVQ